MLKDFSDNSYEHIKANEDELKKAILDFNDEIVLLDLNLMNELYYENFLNEYDFLIKASKILGSRGKKSKIILAGSNIAAVTNEEMVYPLNHALIGTGRVIQQEFPDISFSAIDIKKNNLKSYDKLLEISQGNNEFNAIRGNQKWVRKYEEI